MWSYCRNADASANHVLPFAGRSGCCPADLASQRPKGRSFPVCNHTDRPEFPSWDSVAPFHALQLHCNHAMLFSVLLCWNSGRYQSPFQFSIRPSYRRKIQRLRSERYPTCGHWIKSTISFPEGPKGFTPAHLLGRFHCLALRMSQS